MLVAALVIALSQTPVQHPSSWGEHEWRTGNGFLSEYYFRNGTGFPSGYGFENGVRAGSFYYLLFGTARGSAHFWVNGVETGSAYFWRNGRERGSRYYWINGRGCLSEFGWRNGAVCDSRDILTFQSLCIAQAIDIAPCQAVNARLEDWLIRSSGLSTGDPSAVIDHMRAVID